MNYKDSFIMPQAGADESGKGDFFGGIVVCVFYLDSENYQKLKNESLLEHIKDSKKIGDQKIKEIAPKIMKILDRNYSVIEYSAEEYNKKYKEFKNLNILLSFMYNQAWNSLQEKITNLKDCHSVIDEFTPQEYYKKYLKSINIEPFNIKEFTTKAESKYISCALASIIARYFFIKQIKNMGKEYDIEIPFGNSYEPPNSVITAFKELEEIITEKEIVEKLCKHNFKTLERIK